MGQTRIIGKAYFEDGQLVLPEPPKKSTQSKKEAQSLDYLNILRAIQDIPFHVGKNLLIDFLQGKEDNQSIKKNRLHKKMSFGSLAYEKDELVALINNLIVNDLIEYETLQHNKRWKVLKLTSQGRAELERPQLYKKKLAYQGLDETTSLTEEDEIRHLEYKEYLKDFNDFQKKAITLPAKHILTIAGAGSGKTTVLTTRIDHLIRNHGVDQQKILAITFTRKARKEMQKRLKKLGHSSVCVETFNSFCEKTLQSFTHLIYDKPTQVLKYREKIHIVHTALSKLNISMKEVIDQYYTTAQKKGKTEEELISIFINDCFHIRDYFKAKNQKISPKAFFCQTAKHSSTIKLIIGVVNYINAYMIRNGLRDYTDQLIDTLSFYEKSPTHIPHFEHILVDEYQDVNDTQIQLINTLQYDNLFVVGDPRQSIYGWRGSDLRYIIRFPELYSDAQLIHLTTNYRSSPAIVELINKAISPMRLPDLVSFKQSEKNITLTHHQNESEEYSHVVDSIKKSLNPRHDIFILARTNKQLSEIAKLLEKNKIDHIIRKEELKTTTPSRKNALTLATIHAIKGLEAQTVFVVGCTQKYFPCKGSEHPIIDLLKREEYDKEEEERRLFYVALSRAKQDLHLSYSARSTTYFITESMKRLIRLKRYKKEK